MNFSLDSIRYMFALRARRLVKLSYYIGMSILLVLVLVGYFGTHKIIDKQKNQRIILNILGRQRMFSQRLPFLATETVYDDEESEQRRHWQDYKDAMHRFNIEHELLFHETENTPIPVQELMVLREVFACNSSDKQSEILHKYFTDLNVLGDKTFEEFCASKEQIHDLATRSADFLAIIEQGVLFYEQNANRSLASLESLQPLSLFISIALIAISSMVIFIPMHRKMIAQMDSLRQANLYLESADERYRLVMEGSRDGIWDWDIKNNTFDVSNRYKEIFGLSHSDKITSIEQVLDMMPEEDRMEIMRSFNDKIMSGELLMQNEYRGIRRDGEIIWLLVRGCTLVGPDGTPYRAAGSITDITERKHLEEQLRKEATVDQLTGLNNRRYFHNMVNSVYASAKRYKHVMSVCICDVDKFKHVNDTYGHATGDLALMVYAQEFRDSLRATDFAGRFGGDEFCACFPNTSAEEAAVCLERFRKRLEEKVITNPDGLEFKISCSCGVAEVHEDDEKPAAVFSRADEALYAAKNSGRNSVKIWNEQMSS